MRIMECSLLTFFIEQPASNLSLKKQNLGEKNEYFKKLNGQKLLGILLQVAPRQVQVVKTVMQREWQNAYRQWAKKIM